MKKQTLLVTLFMTLGMFAWSHSHTSTQSHQARINNIVVSPSADLLGSSYYSIGDDGFVIKWSSDGLGEHYQLTNEAIKMIACSPDSDLIAVYESNGGTVNKISVWDWNTLTRKYQKKFTDSITSLKFSAKGTYLIVGTATVDGVQFLNAKSGNIVNKLRDNTGIVSYIHTSDTEKTSVFYSPTGSLSYFNLQTGKLKKKLSVLKGLTNTVLYNDSKLFAGIKDNNICVINGLTGSTIAKLPANSPIILSTESDKNLYYLEYDGKNNYELKMIESLDGFNISNPRIVKTLKGPRGDAKISVGTKDSSYIYLGNGKGSIYKTEVEPSITTAYMPEVTENTYSRIYGMAPAESDFYFLTSNKIYKSSYETSVVENIASTNGQTDITPYKNNNVILWSKESRDPVVMLDLTTKSTETLFTPRNNIQTLKIATLGDKNFIVEIEGNSTVNIYDIDKKQLRNIYTGAGVQDAVLTHDGNIYVAKSAATNPQVPMLCINLETLETVPVKNVDGNVVYALSTDGTVIYGIKLIQNGAALNTYVFSYHTLTGKHSDILKFTNEDAEAFTYLNGNNLFTNIGKNKVYCYNLNTRRNFSYNRSASIPQSVCQNGDRVVILNYNGSISWCSPNNSALETDWYLTKDEQWREF